jgi:uncharacterized protein
MNQPDYSRIQELLGEQRSLTDAAEAHGTLSGCLCALTDYGFQDWMRDVLPEGQAEPGAVDALHELYSATAAALEQHEMEFEPLLPSDAQPLEARTSALAQWCQGFLYGLGSGSIPDVGGLPGEVGEIVRDLAEITRAGVDPAQSEESNETAYAELVEFVRVGVQLLFEELAPARHAPLAAAEPFH